MLTTNEEFEIISLISAELVKACLVGFIIGYGIAMFEKYLRRKAMKK